jgi:hypothetical protein
MITIFNRRRLTSTFDMKRQSEIRHLLAQNGVEYYLKVINSMKSRGRMGAFGVNLQASYQYTFYVKKSDYSKALYFINRN